MDMQYGMKGFDLTIPEPVWIDNEREANAWVDYFWNAAQTRGSLGIDSETTGLLNYKDIVLIWSLSDGLQRVCIDRKFLPVFKPLLEHPSVNLDFAGSSYDAHMFANSGVDLSLAGDWRNIQVMSWMFDENNLGRHGLKEITLDRRGLKSPTFEETFGKIPPAKKGQPRLTPGELIMKALASPEGFWKAVDYASLDAYHTWWDRDWFDGALADVVCYHNPDGTTVTMKDLFYRVAVPFSKVLWRMERRGFTIDLGHFKHITPQMVSKMTAIEKEFAQAAGRLMNLSSSSPDSGWFFYEKLHHPALYDASGQVKYWTDGGASGKKRPKLDANVLDEIAASGDQYANLLLDHRSVAKLYSTYVKGLEEWVDHKGRIHTTLKQNGTVTGRLSSTEPNLQNIPRLDEDPYKLREAFIAGEDKVLVVADYEQLEMRLMAHFSEDPKMIEAIIAGTDLHALTVSEIYGYKYDHVIKAKKAEKKVKEKGYDSLADAPWEKFPGIGNGLDGDRQLHLEDQIFDEVAGVWTTVRAYFEDLLIKRQAAKATGFGIIYGIGGSGLAAQLTKALKKYHSPQDGAMLIQKWLGVFPGVKKFMEATKAVVWAKGKVQTLLGRYRRFGELKSMSNVDRAQCERQSVNSIIQGTAADVAMLAMIQCESDPVMQQAKYELLLQVHDELVGECPDDEGVIKTVKERKKEIMEHPFQQDLLVPLPASVGHGYSWATAK